MTREPSRQSGLDRPWDDQSIEGEKPLEAGEMDDLAAGQDDGEDAEVVEPSDSEVLEAAIFAAQFSGPLPPPEILRAYDEVVDGGANRIFDQWEAETRHRHGLQARMADAYNAGLSRAQWMAFAVIMVIGVGGLIIVAFGHPLVGFAGFFLALATVVASFFRQHGDRAPHAVRGEDEEDSI